MPGVACLVLAWAGLDVGLAWIWVLLVVLVVAGVVAAILAVPGVQLDKSCYANNDDEKSMNCREAPGQTNAKSLFLCEMRAVSVQPKKKEAVLG